MNLPKVELKPSEHKACHVVQIIFEKNERILSALKSSTHLRWSQTMNCWYMPRTNAVRQQIFELLRGKAWMDYSALRPQGPEVHTVKAVSSAVPPELKIRTSANLPLPPLTEVAQDKIEVFRKWLRSRRYSESTIVTYIDALKTFLRFYANKSVHEITNEDIIAFNNEYILKHHLSASFQNQTVNAIKLFYRTVETKNLNPELVHRPKRAHSLPNVLSKEEVKALLGACGNLKHKAMLCLIYSCGLRRGELLKLKWSDIDVNRHLVVIRQAKGRKDRVVPLSVKIMELLREYSQVYASKDWVFEGQGGRHPYDERSLQNVLKGALGKSGITKPVTLHWLRHSYATHLLENGTDLRYIQEILGHSSSRTTEIYTHVSTRSIQKVISPFDSL